MHVTFCIIITCAYGVFAAGEEPHSGIVASVSSSNPAIVTCVEDERLEFQVCGWGRNTDKRHMSYTNGQRAAQALARSQPPWLSDLGVCAMLLHASNGQHGGVVGWFRCFVVTFLSGWLWYSCIDLCVMFHACIQLMLPACSLQCQDGELVTFAEVVGMTQLNNGKPIRIKNCKVC